MKGWKNSYIQILTAAAVFGHHTELIGVLGERVLVWNRRQFQK